MKLFAASFDVVLMRYFLTMFLAVGSFMVGLPWLALLCFPTFMLAILAVKVDTGNNARAIQSTLKPTNTGSREAAA